MQDLGFTLYVADAGPAPGHTRDEDLIARAARAAVGAGETDAGTWVVSPRIEPAGAGAYVVRIVVVPPKGARAARARRDGDAATSVSVRGLVMLRELLSPEAAVRGVARAAAARGAARGRRRDHDAPLRSQGRAVLAVNAGLFGAFTAFTLQSAASGSDDPRVLYPLLALGTGIGDRRRRCSWPTSGT